VALGAIYRERERESRQEKTSENHFGDGGDGNPYGWQGAMMVLVLVIMHDSRMLLYFALFLFSPPPPLFPLKFQKCTLSD
jgi:hypothetical protein